MLSRTKFQDGLAYYESTRDTASHFFIHYLPKGVYVFEYSVRVQLKGNYQTGIASIQSMYAPEFNSHEAGALQMLALLRGFRGVTRSGDSCFPQTLARGVAAGLESGHEPHDFDSG